LLTSGTLTLSGSNVTVDSDATIASTLLGNSGLTESGGGTLSLTGSGNFGAGTVDIEGGTLGIQNGGGLLDGTGYLGYNLNSNGTVTVSGSGSTWSNSATLYVGESGSGTLLVTSGGGVSSVSGAVIGDQAGSTGLATVSGSGGASTWIDGGNLVVSNSGSGTLKVSLGGGVSDVDGWIADGQGSSGLVGVSGTGTTWTNSGTLYVGESGNGTLRVLNGALVSNSNGSIGDQAGAVGMALVTGSGSTWMNGGDLYVGNSGSGTLVVSAGATAISGGTNGISIGNAAGSEGAVTVTGANSTLNNQASNPLQVKNLLVWCQASSLRKFCRPCRGLSRVGRVSGGSASLHPRLIAGWPSGPIIEGTCLTLH
jgi:T5SS/PEP-CTERM-associated repeat protein